MATDQEKMAQQAYLMGMVVYGITLGVWEMVEESASALSPYIGNVLLTMLEKQLGLQIAGEKPVDVLTEVGRIFVDHFGFGDEVKVESTDKVIRLVFTGKGWVAEIAQLRAAGITRLFSHPVLCVGMGALSRGGVKCHANAEADPETSTQTVTFELL